ncbi:uncharacterized protein J8A68_003548 [[Candida] subhashii]|uniref:C2 NT-type domain-containing protein n=1 Tax=[Candida] subhashii TaxID=561895 RepID=A0A8J5QH33_9ASCO|nr:uncharacterized protein J8A68_003548 [[Candida] subhashii]KAG7662922.1 hypothetical protein J8A68_003548 [[Candida] subhashii]
MPMFISSNKPKFSFDLTINELTNIPEISGSCFIELQIRDAKRKIPHLSRSTISKQRSTIKKTDDASVSTSMNGSTSSTSSTANNNSSSIHDTSIANTSSSGNISSTTSRKKLHNFKCIFNYKLSCNLKFGVKKKKNLIANKYLLLKIFYVSEIERHSHHHHHQSNSENGSSTGSSKTHTQITELGRLDINLAEYLNFDEPVTTKYLLNESKVNSILSLTIDLNELPPTFDFHTSLQIKDNISSTTPVSSTRTKRSNTSSLSRTGNTTTPTTTTALKRNTFNIPQFERKHVFGGITNVFGQNGTFSQQQQQQQPLSNGSGGSGVVSPPASPSLRPAAASSTAYSPISSRASIDEQIAAPSNRLPQVNTDIAMDGVPVVTTAPVKQQIMVDPLISHLYCKVLESNWDPELSKLLEYTPEQCINDIFESNTNPNGINQKLKAHYDEYVKTGNDGRLAGGSGSGSVSGGGPVGGGDDDDENTRELNGLISELKYRTDLKSWKLTRIPS